MFAKNKKDSSMANGNGNPDNFRNNIVSGAKIVGEITSSSDIRFDGELKGNVETDSKLVVGETGVIVGDIKCKNAIIEGQVKGTIVVTELLELKQTANVQGSIITNKLSVQPGAIFNGSCEMTKNQTPGSHTSANAKKATKPAAATV